MNDLSKWTQEQLYQEKTRLIELLIEFAKQIESINEELIDQ